MRGLMTRSQLAEVSAAPKPEQEREVATTPAASRSIAQGSVPVWGNTSHCIDIDCGSTLSPRPRSTSFRFALTLEVANGSIKSMGGAPFSTRSPVSTEDTRPPFCTLRVKVYCLGAEAGPPRRLKVTLLVPGRASSSPVAERQTIPSRSLHTHVYLMSPTSLSGSREADPSSVMGLSSPTVPPPPPITATSGEARTVTNVSL
mmetsp:Transcript_38816/g.123362  ORF Transcript_38816/g.123362 Transcript_38816/m.123362 type:complete len:202 (+) Transcript_38816:1566-2171(+)